MPVISESLASLPPLQRRMAEAWLKRFEESWHEQKLRECMRALPSQSSLRRPLLLAMIERDLAHHWNAGRPMRVESYLKDFPELGPGDAIPIELIVAEFNQRQRHGAADLTEFAERFPSRIDDLYVLLKPTIFEGEPKPKSPANPDGAADRRRKLLQAPADLETVDPVSERRLHLLRSAPPDEVPLANRPESEWPELQLPSEDKPASFLPPEPQPNDPTRKLEASPAETMWLDEQDPAHAAPALPERAAPPTPPAVLGRYQIERRLGTSSRGSIVEAVDTVLGRRVALKIPAFSGPDAETERAQFLHEARAAAGLSHPLLCPVLDVGRDEGFDYLVMPFVEGDSLQELMKQRPIWPVRQAIDLVLKLAIALDTAHRRGVIHRNLRPSDILIAPSETPVIVGFGEGRRTDNADDVVSELRSGREDLAGPRIDIYCLGAILYQIATGQAPATGQSAHLTFPPDLDPILKEFCRKAMSADAADRYTSMQQFATDLLQFRQTLRASNPGSRLVPSGLALQRNPGSSTPVLPSSANGHSAAANGKPPAPHEQPAARFTPVTQPSGAFGKMPQSRSRSGTTATKVDRESLARTRLPIWVMALGIGAVILFSSLIAVRLFQRFNPPIPHAPAHAQNEPETPTPKPASPAELIASLQSSDAAERESAASRLMKMKSPDAAEMVEEFIAQGAWSDEAAPKGETRDLALKALLKMDSLRMPAALKRAAKNSDERVRAWAYREMAKKIDADNKHILQPILLGALKDPVAPLRRLAADQIKERCSSEPEVIKALTDRVTDELWGEPNNPRGDGGKNAALEALEEFAPQRVAAALNGAARSPNADVRKWAEFKRQRRDS